MEFKSFAISVYHKKMFMAHHKKTYAQHENQIVKQDFDNPQHFLISSNTAENDFRSDNDSRSDQEYNNEVFYQYNLDDWQG